MAWGSLVLATLAITAQTGEHPDSVVRHAERAVRGDTADIVAARWRDARSQDTDDHAAVLGLATLATLTYRYNRADSLFSQLTERSPGRDPYTVRALIGRAGLMQRRGEFVASVETFERAAAIAAESGDPVTAAEALVYSALSQLRTSGAPSTLATLERASPGIAKGGPRLRALARCVRARAIGGLEGERESEAGAALARGADEPRIAATCLLIHAVALLNRAANDSGFQVIQAAEAEFRRARDLYGLAAVLQQYGWQLRTRGALGEALDMTNRALVYADSSGNASVRAWSLGQLANIRRAFGDLVSARAYAEQSSGSFKAQGDVMGLTVARNLEANLARSVGDFENARRLFRDALENRPPGWAPTYQLVSLAEIEMASGNFPRAEALLDSASGRAAGRPPPYDRWIESVYARLEYLQGKLDRWERVQRAVLNSPYQPTRGYRARVALAEIAARRGNLAEAESQLREAFGAIDRWRARLTDPEVRTFAFQAEDDWMDPDLGVATVLAALASGNRLAAAFELAERRRARELLNRLLRAWAAADSAGPGPPTDPRQAGAPASLDEVRANLPDATALLEYVTGRGGEPTTLFVVTRETARSYQLEPIDSLAASIERLARLLPGGEDVRAPREALGAALLDRATTGLPPGVMRLVIVPDDVIHRVPFDALILADGRLVVERFATSIAPSATVASRLWTRPQPTRESAILALADPTFETENEPPPGSAAEVYRSAFDLEGGLPRLRASAREARRVAAYAPSATVRLREEASEAFMKSAPLGEYTVLHFATHALVDERTATRTSLALSPGDGEDGFLGPGEIAALALDADLVVLSACRTAGGVVVRGEGIQGLTAPFLEAGARSILATAWPIGDRSTVRFVDEVYRGLADGQPISDALRAAKLAALARGAPPAEWAAFTLVGDPTTLIALQVPPRSITKLVLLLGIALVAIATLATVIHKQRGARPPQQAATI